MAKRRRKVHATVHHADLWGLRKTNTTGSTSPRGQDNVDDLNRTSRFLFRRATQATRRNGTGDEHPRHISNQQQRLEDRPRRAFLRLQPEGIESDGDILSKEPPATFQQYRVEDSSSYDIESRRRQRKWSAIAIQRCLYRPSISAGSTTTSG